MSTKPVKIHKGQAFVKMTIQSTQKNIVFDLDETLGCFGDLYMIWQSLSPIIPTFIDSSSVFRELLEIFPEFLRPGIIPILEYLKYKKKMGLCSRVFIYTNNQCSPEWIHRILKYFEEKVPNLFDKAICAFKIGGQRIEPFRTTNRKTYGDLIRCTLLPKNSEICFVDNSYHSRMIHERVYYIQPNSYDHGLIQRDIVDRFIKKWTMFPLPDDFEIVVKGSHHTNRDSFIVSQKIMYYLKEYFLLSTKVMKTKKIGWKLGRFTRKKR